MIQYSMIDFVLWKTSMTWFKTANLSPHCLCRVERATHTNLGIQSKVWTLVLFSWVSCYWASAIKHVWKFPFVCFSLKSFSIEKCINKPFKEQGVLPISGLDDERPVYLHSVGEKASADWRTYFTVDSHSLQSLAGDTRSFRRQRLQWPTTSVLF